MILIKIFKITLLIVTLVSAATSDSLATDFDGNALSGKNHCRSSETWNYTSGKSPAWLDQYRGFLAGKASSGYSFSEAVQLKRLSILLKQGINERDFSEYWVGRILFDLKLDPLAHQVFKSVYDGSENKAIKKASQICMSEIQKRSPDWKAPSPLSDDDPDAVFLASLGKTTGVSKKLPAAYREYLLGVEQSLNRHYPEAIEHLTLFLNDLESSTNPLLKKHIDDARLMLGRAYYTSGKYREAIKEFQTVTKTSNQQIDALSDLSWAYLQAKQFDDAVGVSMQLRVGSLRNTFAPEPLMVAAMALNELCLYPESIRMIRAFVNDYAKSHQWLNDNKSKTDFYDETLKALKKQSTVPVKISTEWMKSPEFLVRQNELNTLLDHPKIISRTQDLAVAEQRKLTTQFINAAQVFVKDVKIAKFRLKPGEELRDSLGDRFFVLKKQLRKLSRYYRASRTWKALARMYEKRLPETRAGLKNKVDVDLKADTAKLLTKLDKIRENSDLIEIEIYNGASQDMIWKNAHNDFDQANKEMEDDKEKPNHAQVWSWGRIASSEIEDAEVWEDEMGALKADISDQCLKKEKYLHLKLMKRDK